MAGVSVFPTLYDILERVRDLVEQPRGAAGSGTWGDQEFSREATASSRYILNQLIDIDRNFQIKETTISVAANAGEIAAASMPSDCIGIIRVYETDNVGRVVRPIPTGTYQELGHRFGYIWLPTDNKIKFLLPEHSALTVGLVYIFKPLPLVHGIAQDGGADTIQLAEHESSTTDALAGVELILAAGTGAGQTGTIGSTAGDYDGPSRTATLAANWAGITGSPVSPVADDTIYTTRPPLPIMAEDAFVYDIASRLLQKLQDERWQELAYDRDRYLKDLRQTMKLADRQQPKRVRDDAGYGGYADPVDRYGSGSRRPGRW